MSAERKARPDARLKTLPRARQEGIAEYAHEHSLEETVVWLRGDGLRIGKTALSNFLSWWRLGQQLQRNESTVASVLNDLRSANPSMAEEELERAGQMFFSALAIEQQNALDWKRTQDVKTKRELLKLAREQFEFSAAKACLAKLPELKAVSLDKGLSDTQKVEAVRLKLFGEAAR